MRVLTVVQSDDFGVSHLDADDAELIQQTVELPQGFGLPAQRLDARASPPRAAGV